MYTDLVVDPAAFFEDRDLDPDGALGIVALTIGLATFKDVVNAVVQARSEPYGAAFADAWVFALPAVWLSFVVGFYAVAFHVPVALDEGGEFADTVAVVGWGFVPKLFVVVAKLGVVSVGDPGGIAGLPTDLVVGSAMGVLTVAALAPSAAIWYHGMAAAHDLDARGAALAVGPPVALAALFDLLALWAAMAGVG